MLMRQTAATLDGVTPSSNDEKDHSGGPFTSTEQQPQATRKPGGQNYNRE
jgi:hypothetical protein